MGIKMSNTPIKSTSEKGGKQSIDFSDTKFLQKVKNFWSEYKQNTAGMIGLVIMMGLAITTVSGLVYKGQQSLTYGTEPRLASPSWMAPFDNKEFKYDEHLLRSHFETGQKVEEVFDSTRTLSTGGGNYTDVSQDYTGTKEESAFTMSFQDIDPSQDINSSNIPVTRKVILSKSFTWEKNPPNGVDFSYFVSSQVDGKLSPEQVGRGQNYSVSVGVYLDSKKFSSIGTMIYYLRDRKGMSLSPDHYDENGIRLSYPIYPSGTGHWQEGSMDLPRRKIILLFNYLQKFNIKVVTTYNINDASAIGRSPGTVALSIRDIDMLARGYYSGPMGTTDKGADLFSLIGQGVVNSLKIGLASSAVTLTIGIMMGLISGWYGGITDELIMRTVDFLMVLPTLPLQLILVVIFGKLNVSRVWGVVMALSLISWAGISRLIRSQVLSVKERPYIEAAKASGATNLRVIFGHILPNVFGLVIYQIVLSMQNAILATASLSFLGLGPEWVSFGNILQRVSGVLLGIGPGSSSMGGAGGGGTTGGQGEIQTGSQAVIGAWWFMFFPGVVLFLFGTALIFIGMTLQDMVQGGEK